MAPTAAARGGWGCRGGRCVNMTDANRGAAEGRAGSDRGIGARGLDCQGRSVGWTLGTKRCGGQHEHRAE